MQLGSRVEHGVEERSHLLGGEPIELGLEQVPVDPHDVRGA